MIEVDSAQREARAREMRHEVVAQITVGTHRTFRILFAVQWPLALVLAWNSALPGDGRLMFTAILGGTFLVMLVVTRELGKRDLEAIKAVRKKRAPGGGES